MEKTETQIENILNEGNVKRTGLFVFDSVEKFETSKENLELIKEILILYKEYVSSLNVLSEYKNNFLRALKQEETKRNHMLENIDPFITSILINTYPKSATMIAIGHKLKNKNLNKKTFIKMNNILINGLNKQFHKHEFRCKNDIFVGTRIGNTKNISYIPIDYKEIDEAADRILKLYNSPATKEEDIFINPMLVHALISSLQLFRDANTRLARIMQHVNLWSLSKKYYNLDLISPALYTSEVLLNKRDEYRELIKEIAINPNNDILNEWIKFNTLMFEKQIYLNQDRLEKCYKAFK